MARLTHFAICADDTARARAFYKTVFGWRFEAWGPPELDFFQIRTGDPDEVGVQGALQKRAETLTGTGMRGFECTLGVTGLDDVLARAVAGGGAVTGAPLVIPGVGRLAFVQDTEGNRLGVMEYGSA